MTDKEAELLRAVEKMLLVLDNSKHSLDDWFGAEKEVRAALSAYRAQPQEVEGEMVTMGLIRSRLSRTLSGTMTPEDEDPRDWEHIGNIVFPMPPAVVIPTIIASITGNIEP